MSNIVAREIGTQYIAQQMTNDNDNNKNHHLSKYTIFFCAFGLLLYLIAFIFECLNLANDGYLAILSSVYLFFITFGIIFCVYFIIKQNLFLMPMLLIFCYFILFIILFFL